MQMDIGVIRTWQSSWRKCCRCLQNCTPIVSYVFASTTANALWAWNLNLSDGGKNIKSLRDTEYNGVLHKMQRDDGVQKGIRTILNEGFAQS